VRRLVDLLGLHRHLGAIGLDHHQTGIVQQLLGIDARLFRMGLFGARSGRRRLIPRRRLLVPRSWLLVVGNRLLDALHGQTLLRGRVRRRLPGFFSRLRFELVDPPLLLR
jgi:hypothetical protein